MNKPIVLLDMDGVMIHSNASNMRRVNEEFGTSYTVEDITDFNYGFMTRDQREFVWKECWNTGLVYEGARLTQEQLITIEKMRKHFRVVACSSPMLGHIHAKYELLCRYFNREDIVLCSDKTIIVGDILVDDGPHNIEAFPGDIIVYDRPWNRHLTDYPRVMEFSELYSVALALIDDTSHPDTYPNGYERI